MFGIHHDESFLMLKNISTHSMHPVFDCVEEGNYQRFLHTRNFRDHFEKWIGNSLLVYSVPSPRISSLGKIAILLPSNMKSNETSI
jgi:hypothetical protein